MAAKNENAKEKGTTEQKFSYAELRKSCLKVFGVTSSTFDGATFGINREGSYTISEIKKTITEWSNKEVK